MDIYLQFKFDARNSWQQGLGASQLKNQTFFLSYFILQSCLYLSEVHQDWGEVWASNKHCIVLCKRVCFLKNAALQPFKVISFHIHLDSSTKRCTSLHSQLMAVVACSSQIWWSELPSPYPLLSQTASDVWLGCTRTLAMMCWTASVLTRQWSILTGQCLRGTSC